MIEWYKLFMAELKKEHRNMFHSSLIYFSLLIWPIIGFITAYYSFKPFQLDGSSPLNRFISSETLALFLLTGYLAYIFFWSLVQSAWQMGYERQSGTLELIFLTPVHRLTFVYGRSFSFLIEGVWLFTIFTFLSLFFVGGININGIWSIPLAFTTLVISAVIWGGFLNTVFLFSRDAGFLYTILDEPMSIFSGVRIPPMAFPLWAKIIALCFPLTYTLQIIRLLVMEQATFIEITPYLLALIVVLTILVIITILVLKKAEQHMKKTGNMVLF